MECTCRWNETPDLLLLRNCTLEMLVHVLDHHDRRVDHRTYRDRDSTERHDVGAHANCPHRDERDEDSDRKCKYRNECRARVHQEDETYERDNDAFLEQFFPQRTNRLMNEIAPVIDRSDHHAWGK